MVTESEYVLVYIASRQRKFIVFSKEILALS